jgi:hypothetical protein
MNAWTDGCQNNYNDDNSITMMDSLLLSGQKDGYTPYTTQCVANYAVYRPTFVSTLFFLISAIASKLQPSLNRQAWPAKYALFFLAILASVFIPNTPLLSAYLILLRVGAMIFILIQQVILIDMAYNWNESWVEKSEECDFREWGSGIKWLRAIIITAVSLLLSSITGIIFLYSYFGNCPENIAVITVTLIGIIIVCALQFFTCEGSFLTSSVISAYASYSAYSIVTKNPDPTCNPSLGSNDISGIIVGLSLTMISLGWTGWSWTAEERLKREGIEATRPVVPTRSNEIDPERLNLDVPFLSPDDVPVRGSVLDSSALAECNSPNSSSIWKLNVILTLVSCWVAASLTCWGSIQPGGAAETPANPQVGRVNMVMIGISQLVALVLYGWTLVAPIIYPDRDFS